MHKLRLKKLETKQRAQEERSKRDAEIQRVSPFKLQRGPKTPFSNYRNHIATLLYRNIVSYPLVHLYISCVITSVMCKSISSSIRIHRGDMAPCYVLV